MNRLNWTFWFTWFAVIVSAALLGAFHVTRLYVALFAAIVAFAFALWRFPFVYPSGLLALLVGAVFLVAHLVFGSLSFLLEGTPGLTDWTIYAGAGLGFITYGCIALAVGKRPPAAGNK